MYLHRKLKKNQIVEKKSNCRQKSICRKKSQELTKKKLFLGIWLKKIKSLEMRNKKT